MSTITKEDLKILPTLYGTLYERISHIVDSLHKPSIDKRFTLEHLMWDLTYPPYPKTFNLYEYSFEIKSGRTLPIECLWDNEILNTIVDDDKDRISYIKKLEQVNRERNEQAEKELYLKLKEKYECQ
jgi:hypothetical protein